MKFKITYSMSVLALVLTTIATVSSFSTVRVAKPPVSNSVNCGAFVISPQKLRECMSARSVADGLAFSPFKSRTVQYHRTTPALFASSSDDDKKDTDEKETEVKDNDEKDNDKKDNDENNDEEKEENDDISSMKASDIRKELESYGISTKSFFEKSEFVEALKKARAEGRTPVEKKSSSSSSSSSTSSSTSSSSSSSSSPSLSREEKIAIEVDKCKAMKVGELKKELQSLGISTKSFFEKSEFVKALAEARVDGVKGKKGTAAAPQQEEEEYDPSYRDVTVQKFKYDPFSAGGPLIDIRLG